MNNKLQRWLGFFLMGIGAVLISGGIYVFTRPNEYEAHTRIIIKWQNNNVETAGIPKTAQQFAHDEIARLQTDQILTNVVTFLDLPHRWRADNRSPTIAECVAQIQRRLDVRLVHENKILEIRYRDENVIETADIANAIAQAYCTWSRTQHDKLWRSTFIELEKQADLLQQEITSKEAELDRIKRELQIPAQEPPNTELETRYPEYASLKTELKRLRDLRQQLIRKLNVELTDMGIPRHSSAAEIIELALPPASPKSQSKLSAIVMMLTGLPCIGWGISVITNLRPPPS